MSRYDLYNDRPSLNMNERIVWISDNGPEYGNVRWLGKLPDLGREWMAGVEFDNPVGSGTGLYKDEQLFITRLNHASLVPVIGLLKASDFDGPPEPPARTSSIQLIDFDDYESDWRSFHHDDPLQSIDEIHSKLQSQIERNSKNKITIQAPLPNKLSSARVRNIPIRVDRDEDHHVESRVAPPPVNQSNKPDVARSGHNSTKNRTEHRQQHQNHVSSINELTSSLKQVALERLETKLDVATLLPPPALIAPPGDTSAAITLKNQLGKFKGIQGHNNSCYMDSTLFAMFSSTTLFDSLLYRPRNQNDIPEYDEIQHILREEIVRPLRKNCFVSADQVMKFRHMLDKSSNVEGLTDEEKDPEEFLSLLLGQILKAEHYLKLSSGLESHFYQLIVDKDESVVLPTVQDLFEQSFVTSPVRLREIPPCLLLHMPRFGRQYKMYSRIMPSLNLDITDVLETAPRACGHKGKDCDNIARYECKDCLTEKSGRHVKLSNITYCNNCFQSKHFGKSHVTGIEDHFETKTTLSSIPHDALSRYSNKLSSSKEREIPRIRMDLFAVLCIETSHYVCFVKAGNELDSPWCFFDSMADRRGEQNGENIPEVQLFDEFAFWTSDNGANYLFNHTDDKQLPEMAKRLICDAYLCFYRYNGLTTYR